MRRRMSADCHPAAQEVTADHEVPREKASLPVSSARPKRASPAVCHRLSPSPGVLGQDKYGHSGGEFYCPRPHQIKAF